MISPAKSVAIGIVVGIITLAMQSLGLTLQRKSHLLEDAKPSSEYHRPPYRRPLWRLGCFLFIFSNMVGSSIQISTLPLIVLSPLQAVGLVFNSICGALVLGEIFTVYTLRGTLLVSLGAFFIAYFGSIPEPNHNLSELIGLLKEKPFLIWLSVSICILVGILSYISVLNYLIRSGPIAENDALETDPLIPKDSASTYSSSPFVPSNIPFVQGILYGVICGILSAQALLLAKSAVELVIIAISEKTVTDLKSYQSWLIISGWVFCAISQVYYLNLGLKIISSSIIFPLIFCVYNMANILNGLIYFQQFNKLSLWEIAFIFIGVCLILFGVFYLSINDIMTNNILAEECLEANMNSRPPSLSILSPLSSPTSPSPIANSLSINTSAGKDLTRIKPFVNTPSSSVSKAFSLTTNSSTQPLLSESFDGDRFAANE